MGFTPRLNITKNIELLYQKGDILFCPMCHKEHYEIQRDIYKKDRFNATQVKALSDDILDPGIDIDHRCQSCLGGWKVPLIQKVDGLELRK
jgi:hypothetical protein